MNKDVAFTLSVGAQYSTWPFPNLKIVNKKRFADCECGAKQKTLYRSGRKWLCLKCVNKEGEREQNV